MASTTSSSSPDIDSTFSSFTQRAPFSPPTDHANGQTPEELASLPIANGNSSSQPIDNETLSSTPSPAPLTLRSFLLGLTLGFATLLTLVLAYQSNPLWRLPFFLSSLSLFHYFEYQTTALFNPTAATVSAFLLSQNGRAYNIAHTLAFFECAIRWHFYPEVHMASATLQAVYMGLGFMMMVLGQGVRTAAMAQAGANFSHIMRMKKKSGHVLVIDGVYKWLRHPSYFGFFWWGLGSQIVLGNGVCLLGYVVVLWRFFRLRIESRCSRWPTL